MNPRIRTNTDGLRNHAGSREKAKKERKSERGTEEQCRPAELQVETQATKKNGETEREREDV